MDIEYRGANSIVLTSKKLVIAIDPATAAVTGKNYVGKMNIMLATQEDLGLPVSADTLAITSPGEYEVGGISITGIPARRHLDSEDQPLLSTMYRLDFGDVVVAVLGHIAPMLSESQLEALGVVDVLIVPVGGNGYTLDPHAAMQIARQIDPRVIIPTHFAETGLDYEMPQLDLEVFTKESGTIPEPIDKLKIKNGVLPETLTVYHLKRIS